MALVEAATIPEIPELSFGGGLAGFPAAHRFALTRWGDDPTTFFSVLHCLDIEGLDLVVVPPHLFFPGYEPEIDDDTVAELGITDPAEAIVLSIVTVGESAATCTANLLGPIVVNLRTLGAAQVVLAGDRWSTREPLAG